MFNKKNCFFIIGLVFTFLFFVSFSCVSAVDHNVTGTSFSDIQFIVDGVSDGDTVLLGNRIYSGSSDRIVITNKRNILISGRSDSERAVVDARHLGRIFVVDENSTVIFKYIDFVNGDAGASSGAAISAYNTIIIENCSFRNNWGESGGAIFIRPGADNSRIVNSSFINNEGRYEGADEFVEGGAIDTHANFTSIINCVFTGNSALSVGGAVNFASNTIGQKLIGSTFRNNYAPTGGAIRSINNNLLIEDCIFIDNYANETSGGAIYSRIVELTIINSTFTGNHAIRNGGTIYNVGNSDSSYLNISDSVFRNNQAFNGGAIYSENQLIILFSSFLNNRADSGNAGAIYSEKTSLIKNSNFTNSNGIAIILDGIGTTISGNSIINSTEHGIFSRNFRNGIIYGNTIVNNGGTGLYLTGNNNQIYDNFFNSNNNGVVVTGNNTNFTLNNITNNRNNGVNLSGNNLKIYNNSISSNKCVGFVLSGNGPVIVDNIFVSNGNHGFFAQAINNAIIFNNLFSANRGAGFYSQVLTNGNITSNIFSNNVGSGLYLAGNNNKINGNIFSANGNGVVVTGNNTNFTLNNITNNRNFGVNLSGNNLKIYNNIISSNKGIGLVLSGNGPVIVDNTFFSNGNHGFYAQTINNAIIFNNLFSANKGAGFHSQVLNNGNITSNIFSNNRGTGFYTKGNKNKVSNNNFTSNNVGINIIGNDTNFKDNNVTNNLLQGILFTGNHVYVGYNNIMGNKRNGVKVKGNYAFFEKNMVTGNSINKKGNCVILVEGNNAKIRYNFVKNNNFHGIHVFGSNSQIIYNNIQNNKGGELIISGNNGLISYNNISSGDNGIYLVGNKANITYNNVYNNKLTGITVKGNYTKIYKNKATNNKGRGLYFIGSNSKITSNILNTNLQNGLRGGGNKNLFKDNSLVNNSKKGKYCAILFKGNYNNYTKNKVQTNGFHGLHIKGNNNRVTHTVSKNNKNTQIVVFGNKNYLNNITVYNGFKSGLGIYGNNNLIIKSKTYKNKENGLIIKGNYNQINKTIISYNNVGIFLNGSKNKIIQNTIKSNNVGIKHKTGKNDYYNYNNIVNKKYNLYLEKGSVNAEFNWWGENKKAKIKNAKINRYVTASLVTPNILKLKKVYNIYVKFTDDKNKKLKYDIPALKVGFSFNGLFSPKSYNVTKNIAKGKIKVKQYDYYKLLAKVDNQKLYKYYIGDSKGKVNDLNKYISMLLNKEGIKPNKLLVTSIAKKIIKDINKINQKADHKTYLLIRNSLSKSLKNMKDGPEKWFLGMILANMPKYTFAQFIKEGGLRNLFSQGPLGFLVNYYTTGKINDANKKNNGDLLKILGDSFIKLYGYSNINNVWGSENWKIILEYGLGIDKNGNMSIGDALLNAVSILFSFGLGGIVTKLGKTGLTSLSKIFPKSIINTSTQLFRRLSALSKNVADKFLPQVFLDFFSDYSVRQGIVDVSKIFTGDYTGVLKQITKIPQLKSMGPLVDAVNIYTKGFKGLVGYLDKNILSEISSLNRITAFTNFRAHVNNVKKGINSSISSIKSVVNSVNKTVKTKATQIKATITKTLSSTKAGLKNLYNGIKAGATNLYNNFKSTATSWYNGAKSALTGFVNKYKFW
jgi:predicted outer membrane repeat protein/parallel beta-helix repeat protein